jgi:DNA-binding CsgD family transcriptional regulator
MNPNGSGIPGHALPHDAVDASPGAAVIRVALQDRRRIVCSGMKLLIEAEPDLALAGCVADDRELRDIVLSRPVDVAAFEIRSTEWDVTGLAASLRREVPSIRLIGLHRGRRTDHEGVGKAVGVDILHSYGAGTGAFLAALRGRRAESAEREIERRQLPGREVLTPREREVLRHISAGLTTQQSAGLLEVSPKTVDNHKQRMFAKLGVQNQAHAVAIAHRLGVLGNGDASA